MDIIYAEVGIYIIKCTHHVSYIAGGFKGVDFYVNDQASNDTWGKHSTVSTWMPVLMIYVYTAPLYSIERFWVE